MIYASTSTQNVIYQQPNNSNKIAGEKFKNLIYTSIYTGLS